MERVKEMRMALTNFINATQQQMDGEDGKGSHRNQITVDDGVTALTFGYGYFQRGSVLVHHQKYNPDGSSNRIIVGQLPNEDAVNTFMKRYEENQ